MQDEDSDPHAIRPPPTSLTAKDLYDVVEAYVTQMRTASAASPASRRWSENR